jgi:hypothetical protein
VSLGSRSFAKDLLYLVFDHPTTIMEFVNGQPNFSIIIGREICTTRAFRGNAPKSLCLNFNLGENAMASTATRGSMRAPYAGETTPPSLGPPHVCESEMGPSYLDATVASSPFLAHTLSPHAALTYTDLLPTVHPHLPIADSNDILDMLLDLTVMPYDADAFEQLWEQKNLTSQYPHLVRNLRQGFPIGRMPKLDKTIILPNHPSADIERDTVLEYIAMETAASRMSGPFTCEEMHRICHGHFYVSPLIVSVNDQGPDLPPKKRVCRNLSKAAPQSNMAAVNDFIDKADFPTCFNMPWRMAEIVSVRFYSIHSILLTFVIPSPTHLPFPSSSTFTRPSLNPVPPRKRTIGARPFLTSRRCLFVSVASALITSLFTSARRRALHPSLLVHLHVIITCSSSPGCERSSGHAGLRFRHQGFPLHMPRPSRP